MSIEQPGHAPLDYDAVSYPGSMVEFRGPEVDLTQAQVVCLGASETYGRFVPYPYAQLLAANLGRSVANLGALNAGLELILHDTAINTGMAHAQDIVLQITGAHMMTNRFYRVHPRRNDRFLRASSALSTVYRHTDFTDFHFVRHMLSVLAEDSPDRFAIVVRELQEAWVARMITLIDRVDAAVHLLWFAESPPNDDPVTMEQTACPLFITRAMVDQVAGKAASLTECTATDLERAHPTRGMFFGPREAAAARLMPGPVQHDRAADMLAKAIRT